MKLTELDAKFVRYETRNGSQQWTIPVEAFADAQGIMFLCPVCFTKNNGPVGTHLVDVTFEGRGAAADQGSHGTDGQPTRWAVSGDRFENLTTSPSVLLVGGCGWHGFITNGDVT